MSIDRDDALLDALAQGEPGPDGDDLAGLLAAWRDDIDTDPAPDAPVRIRRSAVPRNRGRFSGPSRPFGPGPVAGPDRPPRRKRRLSRPVIIAAVAAILATGGLTIASATAEPGGPLWPITQLVFNDRAQSRVAEQEANRLLREARAAIDSGRAADAVPMLHDARTQILLVTEAGPRQRLHIEFNALLARLSLPIAPPPPSTNPGVPGSSARPTLSPSPSPSGLLDPILPILPSLLPNLPLPLPSLPLLG